MDSPEHREVGSEKSKGLPVGVCSGVGDGGRGEVGEEGSSEGVGRSITFDDDDIPLSAGWGPKGVLISIRLPFKT